MFGYLNGMAVAFLHILQLSYEIRLTTKSARILFFSSSMTAYMFFVYFTSDLTAKMTSGIPPVPIRSFKDVLDMDLLVTVMKDDSNNAILARYSWYGSLHRLVLK